MISGNVLILPRAIQRRLDAALSGFLYAGIASERDFLVPDGEPALVPHDSVAWRVFRNPVTVFIGGVTAVILELAEPRVRTGVWEHTSFRDDPLPRLQRTGFAAMMTVYGPAERARAMIARVGKMHARIEGTMPNGQQYRADDPELLDWVQATASFGFLEAYHAYARNLDNGRRDRFYAECLASAHLYGAIGAPASQHELGILFDRMRVRLEPSPIVFDFLRIMERAPILPRSLAPVQRWLVQAAVDILPQWLWERLRLNESRQHEGRQRLHPWQRQIVSSGAAIADRILLTSSPAVQSCRRLGLPDDYLHGGMHEGRSAAW